MSQYPYREASYRSTAHVDFEPPAWWAPHSSETHLLRETRATIGSMQDADFMTWLDDRGREGETLTFAGLWRKALAVSRKMVDDWGVETGDRVLLCYLPGMAFMVAFWGCLRLRVVAVPVYPPDPNKLALGLKKLDLVKQSCGSSLCLTEKALDQMRIALSLTHRWPPGLVWKRTDRELKFKDASDPDVPLLDDAVAFLQYTSGSTGDPKGVMLTFANIWHNLNEMYLPAQRHHLATRGVAAGERITGVSWLPQFHDTGLVLCIVGPFVAGYRMVNFSPLTFLKMPLLWLEAMSKYGAHWSAAPDFAYELCVRRLGERAARDAKAKENGDAPKAHAPIDLASIRQFACGAGERCRPAQLERFMETFKPYGLREDVYVPNYGLAEHVVGTCGCARGLILSKSRPDLACCGEDFQCDLRIVDPTSRREATRGEIWISSKSVAAGYWGKKELSTETFHARLVLDDAGTESRSRYVRTGDEAFLEDGMLFINGRLKDLIIVGGKNYYPEDIEVAAQEANRDVIRPGCVAAFAAEENAAGAEEKVVCVFELRKTARSDAATLKTLTDDVARAVGVASGLQPDRVLVIPERSIPKTTSGKVQRRQTRAKVQDGSLKVLFDTAGAIEPMARSYGPLDLVRDALAAFPWTFGASTCADADKDKDKDAPEADASPAPSEAAETRERAAPPATPSKRAAEVEATLLAAIRAVATGPVVATTAFYELGLSSRQMVELLRKIEGELDLELPPTVVFSCPTVRALAAEIVSMTGGGDDSDGEGTGAQAGFDGVGARGGLSRRGAAPLRVAAARLRLPGSASSLGALRAVVLSKSFGGSRVPAARWDWRAVDAALARRGGNPEARARAAYGAFSDGARGFEPRRYGFRPAEAAALDPQQRLLLDLTYGALVSRSPDRGALRGAAVGVCAGMMSIDAVLGVPAVDVGPHDLTGNGYAAAGSRLSFLLDLRGPCVVVDTACSGALVAAALAAKFVRDGDADAEIAAGVSLMLAPSFVHVGAAAAGMTSPSGACRAFDASADGYCRGEGCSALVLEPADDAGAPAPAWAASTCAHNGQSATFTALNATSQRRLVEACLLEAAAAGPARTLGAVEAHGTGTRLGDPIELGGLAAALGRSPGAVRVAGVKGCLGHGEPNAGGAGVLAALGALAGDSAPNGRLRRANPVTSLAKQGLGTCKLALPADGAPDRGADRVAQVAAPGLLATAGVSSFGYSGIIAHAILAASDGREPAKVAGDRDRAADDGFSRGGGFAAAADARRTFTAEATRKRAPGEVSRARALETWRFATNASLGAKVALAPDGAEWAFRGRAALATLLDGALAAAAAVAALRGADDAAVVGLAGVEVPACLPDRRYAEVVVARLSVVGDALEWAAGGDVLATATLLPPSDAALGPRRLRGSAEEALDGAAFYARLRGATRAPPRVVGAPGVARAFSGARGSKLALVRGARPGLVDAARQLANPGDGTWHEPTSVETVFAAAVPAAVGAAPAATLLSMRRSAGTLSFASSTLALARLSVSPVEPARYRTAAAPRAPALYDVAWGEAGASSAGSCRVTLLAPRSRASALPRAVRSRSATPRYVLGRRAADALAAPLRPAASRVGSSASIAVDGGVARLFGDADDADAAVARALGGGTVLEAKLVVAASRGGGSLVVSGLEVALGSATALGLGLVRALAGAVETVVLTSDRLEAATAAAVVSAAPERAVVDATAETAVSRRVNGFRSDALWTRAFVGGDDARAAAWVDARRRGRDVAAIRGRLSVKNAREASAVAEAALRCATASPALAFAYEAALLSPARLPSAAKAAPPRRAAAYAAAAVTPRQAATKAAMAVLGLDEIDPTANLGDLGMDSLQGTEFAREIGDRLRRTVSPSILVAAETLDEVVALLEAECVSTEDVPEAPARPPWAEAVPDAPPGVTAFPSSPDQELLLWMLRRRDKRANGSAKAGGYAWLPPTAVGKLVGKLDAGKLKAALDAVVDRHDALRCRLVDVPGANRALVVVGADAKPKLETAAADSVDAAVAACQAYYDADANDPFAARSLLRALLVAVDAETHVLFLACNHAVSDGWSHQVLYGELVLAYNALVAGRPAAADLPAVPRSYGAFLGWQASLVSDGAYGGAAVVAQREAYAAARRLPDWPRETPDAVETLFSTGALLRSDATAVVDAATLGKLSAVLRGSACGRASLPSAVLAAYAFALRWLPRDAASVVQYSHSGRVGHDELHRTYGQLASDMNVVLPPRPAGDGSVGSFVAHVHASVLDALSLAAVPYAVAYAAAKGGPEAEAPLPAQYNWYDRYTDVVPWAGLEATELGVDATAMKRKTFNVGAIYLMALVQGDGALLLKFFFNEHVYSRATVDAALADASRFLAALAAGADAPVPEL